MREFVNVKTIWLPDADGAGDTAARSAQAPAE
jgi:hypothetical protein